MRMAAFSTSLPINRDTSKHLLIYPEHNLVYNRIKKAANSSILMYNLEVIRHNIGISTLTFPRYRKAKNEARALGKDFRELGVRELAKLRQSIKYTVVRNPYTRVLSAFRQKVAIRAMEENNSYRGTPGYADDSAQGFREFVNFLENAGLYKNRHWWPQIDLLAIPPEYFDFIVHVERLSSELPQVYKGAGLSIPASMDFSKPHKAEKTDQRKITSSSKLVEAYYDEDLLNRVANLYASDFESFGYSRDPDSDIGI